MFDGHGDDILNFKNIRVNLSSNVYPQPWNAHLFRYLSEELPAIENYPEVTPSSLEAEIAEQNGVPHDCVTVTSGATEAIYIIAHAFRGCRSCILQPTFAEYGDACQIYGHTMRSINCLSQIGENMQMVWICNPNNPTGCTISREKLLRCILGRPDAIFVIDASYAPFTDIPTIIAKEVIGMENVILLHSMTKEYSIPGLRLGYAIAAEKLSEKLRAFRIPWSVNTLAIKAGHFLLAHKDRYAIDYEMVKAERERLAAVMKGLGVYVYPSDTHILLCELPDEFASRELKRILAEDYGILIRDASNFHGLTPRHFRIAIHSAAENEAFINAIRQILQPSCN